MPTVGGFHSKFWRARANALAAAGTATAWMYPGVQSAVITLSMMTWFIPIGVLRPLWQDLRRVLRVLWIFWRGRQVLRVERVEAWLHRVETCTVEELGILDRVLSVMDHPAWPAARLAVRACAHTPKFNEPAHWIEYGRALKANAGQAQNVFRHIKVVHELTATGAVTNPEAHLLTELAYQGFAVLPERRRRLIDHPVLSQKVG